MTLHILTPLCFVCAEPASAIRSITLLTAPPTGPGDLVAICNKCGPFLSSALLQCTLAELAVRENTPVPTDFSTTLRSPNLLH